MFISCNTDNIANNTQSSNAVDVFVVGEKTDYDFPRAFYWKNETLNYLTNENQRSSATEISVQDNQVYICGELFNDNFDKTAVYWENGIIHTIEQNAETHDILKSGNDLYITGVDSNNACVYWKNGVKNILTTEAVTSSKMKMKMVGNDLFINGAEMNSNGTDVNLLFWKNGVKNIIYTGFGETSSIDVENNIVYLSGKRGLTGNPSTIKCFYSKNNEIITLDDIFSINKIDVENADVHLCGQNNDFGLTPYYWKNGMKTNYSNSEDLNDISIVNSNLFACGNNRISDKYTIWINNVLSSGPEKTKANAICVILK